jgi:hypothetical protein
MSTKCQVCGAKSQLFLCREHTNELRATLEELPQWIEWLADEAVGRVRKASTGRRHRVGPDHLDGDASILPRCTCGHDEHVDEICLAEDESDAGRVQCPCREYHPSASQDRLRRQFLATGGCNSAANDLIDAVQNSITTWQRHICDQRRTDWVRFVETWFVGPLLPGEFRRYNYPAVADAAHWLAWHVNAIACDETAGECLQEFRAAVRKTRRLINPPEPRKYLGRCPTWRDDDPEPCGFELDALETAIQVTCPKCRFTHNCNRLQLSMMDDLDNRPTSIENLLKINKIQPKWSRVSERTLRHWRATGRLSPHSHDDDGEPLYLWADVTRLRSEKFKRKASA